MCEILKKLGKLSKEQLSVEKQCYLLIAFPLIGYFVFILYPMIWTVIKSFYFYDKTPSHTVFTGLANYISIFTQETEYWYSWLTTLKFALYKIPFEAFFSLILAYMLSKNVKFQGFYKSVYFIPSMISVAVIGVIFSNMFSFFGYINGLLIRMGFIEQEIDWFANKHTALFVLVVGSVWQSFGVNVMYYSAALTNVPDDLYEAANIDGANAYQKFFRITIPMIAPVFQTILLLSLNGTLQIGEYIITMTNGAPGGMTHTAASYIIAKFLPGFSAGSPNLGYGSALSLVSSVIFTFVAIIYYRLSNKMREVY